MLALVVLAVALAGAGAVLLRRPSHARTWATEQAVLPHVTIRGDSLVRVENVRDFTYRTATDFTPHYDTRTYDLRKLERVWYALSPFNPDWRGPAHAFTTFGFSDGQYVAVSVEGRRERGEPYGLFRGAVRGLELIYVIADERDVIGLRAGVLNEPVYLFPGRATPEQARVLFLHEMRRAQGLERRPEFYNTLTNNCTTNVLDAVNAAREEPIPYGPEVLLPGYSDDLALKLGLLDTDLPLEQARERFRVDPRAADHTAPDFSERIRRR